MAKRHTAERIAEDMCFKRSMIVVLAVIICGCTGVCTDEIYVVYNPVHGSFTATKEKAKVYVAHAVFNNSIQENG